MSERDDRGYFLKRARHERDIANCSEDNAVALAHYRMADEYERRAAHMVQSARVGDVQL